MSKSVLYLALPAILFLSFIDSGKRTKDQSKKQSWVVGNIEYSIADYRKESFVKEYYANYWHQAMYKTCSAYFRNTSIHNFPKRANPGGRTKGCLDPTIVQQRCIEPLVVDLNTFNGIYSVRIWRMCPLLSPHFRCGYIHYNILIKDDKYYYFKDDTTKNQEMIRKKLSDDFPEDIIKRAVFEFKYDTDCNSYTFQPPCYYQKGDSVLWDIHRAGDFIQDTSTTKK